MKKLIIIIPVLIGLYYVSLVVRGKLAERRADEQMAFLLHEISQPWSAKQLRHHGTEWLRNQAKMTPEELASGFDTHLGSLREIVEGPDCAFGSSRFPGEMRQTIWAWCAFTARYEKATARLKIRLVEEPRPPAKFFRIYGESLKINDFSDLEFVE
jgi:hypothetical protein